ncbi:hypothetical protein EA467_11990 [Enterococcus faecium]|nr:hypothetical protein EA467_11990 [Enterococcus faecium]
MPIGCLLNTVYSEKGAVTTFCHSSFPSMFLNKRQAHNLSLYFFYTSIREASQWQIKPLQSLRPSSHL